MNAFARLLILAQFFILAFIANAQITNQISLLNVGHFNGGGFVYSLALSGDRLYLAEFNGFRICDVSNPTNPVPLGYASDAGSVRSIAISYPLAYLATGTAGLRVYDISTATNPVSVGQAYYGGYAGSVAVSGDYAYMVGANDFLRIYNISNPTNPIPVGHGPYGTDGVVVSESYAYVTMPNSTHTMAIYDVSNPTNPTTRYVSSGGYVMGPAVSGSRLCAASQGFENGLVGLLVFDVSNPTNPVLQARANVSIRAGAAAAIQGNFAYLANGANGLDIFDISNPIGTNIFKVGHADSTGTRLAVRGHHVFMANQSDGVRIYAMMPRLTLNLTSTNTLVFSWAAPATYRLQPRPSANFGIWTTLTNAPVSLGANDQLIVSPPINNTYYRLISGF